MKRNCNQFWYLDGPCPFSTCFWSSQFSLLQVKGVGLSLKDSSKPVEQCVWACHIERLQTSSYWWTSPSKLHLKYLFNNTYKDAPLQGYITCQSTTCLNFLWHSIFDLNMRQQTSQDLNPPKADALTIELHYIDSII